MKIVIAITTFNRLNRFSNLFSSLIRTLDKKNRCEIIIADDGSTDGTIEYIEDLIIEDLPIFLIKNKRQGIHHQFNTIVRKLEELDFDYCFKCDDDIEFIKPGWDDLYIKAIKESGYDHICHYDKSWRSNKNLKNPVVIGDLISFCKAKDVQGAFFTLTPKVIKEVGYMDIENFGFRGVGHVDYTLRACRAGFNNINSPFDIINSNEYIKHQKEDYKSAMDIDVQNALENDEESRRKYKLIFDENRLYIPLNTNKESLTSPKETELLKKRIRDLENQKAWYENNYGHQPKWFVRLGKILRLISKPFN